MQNDESTSRVTNIRDNQIMVNDMEHIAGLELREGLGGIEVEQPLIQAALAVHVLTGDGMVGYAVNDIRVHAHTGRWRDGCDSRRSA